MVVGGDNIFFLFYNNMKMFLNDEQGFYQLPASSLQIIIFQVLWLGNPESCLLEG